MQTQHIRQHLEAHAKDPDSIMVFVNCCLEYYKLFEKEQAALEPEEWFTTRRIKLYVSDRNLIKAIPGSMHCPRLAFAKLLDSAAFKSQQSRYQKNKGERKFTLKVQK